MMSALGLLEIDMEHLDRIERKIDTIEEHSRERHKSTMDELTSLRDRLSSVDRSVGVLQERGDSTQRSLLDHEHRLRGLETFRWYLHGAVVAIATAVSWLVNHLFGGNGR